MAHKGPSLMKLSVFFFLDVSEGLRVVVFFLRLLTFVFHSKLCEGNQQSFRIYLRL